MFPFTWLNKKKNVENTKNIMFLYFLPKPSLKLATARTKIEYFL